MEREDKIVTVYCETKRFDGDDATKTKLTLDFSRLEEPDIMRMAIESAVIKWQSSVRRKANRKENAEPIPREATYVVPKPGTRATGSVSERAALVKMVGEERATRLINAANGDVHAVIERVREMLG